MLSNSLLIGQYYPTGSILHRLDARAKIIASMLYMVTLFVAKGWPSYGLLTAVFVLTLGISRVPPVALLRGLKLIFIFMLLTVLLNAFFTPGEALWSWHSFVLTREGLVHGAAMGLRLLLLVSFAALLTLITEPLSLTDGLESLLKPLRHIGVPAHEIAMMMSIALRFIPTILEEFDRIVLAQRARGASVAKGNIMQRMAAMMPLLVPLFVAAFRRAEELAQAMEAKCYRGGEGRSRWRVNQWHSGDTLYVGFFVILLLVMIASRIL